MPMGAMVAQMMDDWWRPYWASLQDSGLTATTKRTAQVDVDAMRWSGGNGKPQWWMWWKKEVKSGRAAESREERIQSEDESNAQWREDERNEESWSMRISTRAQNKRCKCTDVRRRRFRTCELKPWTASALLPVCVDAWLVKRYKSRWLSQRIRR